MKPVPKAHIDVEVTFLSPTEGGRMNPPILVWESGSYRPHIVIGDAKQRKAIIVGNEIQETYLGIVFVSGPDKVRFGETIEAKALLMYYPSPEYDSVVAGAQFTVREGARIVGYGKVKRVLIEDDAQQALAADSP
jgi:hypothetical protein